MIDQQPRDKTRTLHCSLVFVWRSTRGSLATNMSEPAKASVTGTCTALLCLFMTLQGEIKNIKINSENGREACSIHYQIESIRRDIKIILSYFMYTVYIFFLTQWMTMYFSKSNVLHVIKNNHICRTIVTH